jgi:hypothetical protein
MKRLLLVLLLALLCLSCAERVMERATVVHVTCEFGGCDCFTVVKFKDDTVRRRSGDWGPIGTEMWVYKCSRGKTGWCNP